VAAASRGELLDRRHAARHAGFPLSRLSVRLTPSGGADRIDGRAASADGQPYLKARVRAAPEDNAANRALEALIAKAFGVAKGKIKVARGATARLKSLEIDGAGAAEIAAFIARFEEKP
jgi:uncharacterized protein YggU (UPF0235/DUF167 family)